MRAVKWFTGGVGATDAGRREDMNDMRMRSDPATPPSRFLLSLELRAIWEFQAFLATYSHLRNAPRGDGHPVLVLPGLGAGDKSTLPLRTYLKAQGYAPEGWNQGKNRGPRPGVEARMEAQLAQLAEAHRRKVSLIGWSLGGIYARELARRAPDSVRQVITLGSPFANNPKASNAWRFYEAQSGRKAGDGRTPEMKRPPPVPSTAIYTRTDGIVAWQGCREQKDSWTQNIEVEGSHCGLGHNPLAVYAIADRLAQPEDEWAPFDRGGLRRFLYPDPERDEDHGDPFGATPFAAALGLASI